jgi:hypothetical protein
MLVLEAILGLLVFLPCKMMNASRNFRRKQKYFDSLLLL